jgi:hypothetical protein
MCWYAPNAEAQHRNAKRSSASNVAACDPIAPAHIDNFRCPMCVEVLNSSQYFAR